MRKEKRETREKETAHAWPGYLNVQSLLTFPMLDKLKVPPAMSSGEILLFKPAS